MLNNRGVGIVEFLSFSFILYWITFMVCKGEECRARTHAIKHHQKNCWIVEKSTAVYLNCEYPLSLYQLQKSSEALNAGNSHIR